MIICEKIKEKEFIGGTTKEAYLNACKWLSTNVIAVNNSKNITYRFEKLDKTGIGTKKVKLVMYVYTDEEEIKIKHCDICKEVTGAFFMAQNKYMCETCKVQPYRERIKTKLKALKEGLKGSVL